MRTIKFLVAMAVAAVPLAHAQQFSLQPAILVQDANMQVGQAKLVLVKQVKDDLFAGTEKFATGATEVTEINLDPKMMGMVAGNSGMTPASPSAQTAKKMKFMVIHTYTYDKPGMYKMEDVEAYRKKLEDGTWSCSIHVRDRSGSTDICSRNPSGSDGSEMVILTAEPKELTFIHMSGKMSLDELSRMGGSMGGVDGMNRHVHATPLTAPVAPVAPVAPAPPAPPR